MNSENKEIKWIDTTEALKIFKKHPLAKDRYSPNRQTLLIWTVKYDLGYKFAGRWQINKQKFIEFLDSGVK